MKCENEKRVIVTGATGLIGREIADFLEKRGYEMIPLSSRKCDILNSNDIKKFFDEVSANYLIHLAWITTGDYLNSDMNKKYCEASKNLFERFIDKGGKRIIGVGTCFEYMLNKEILSENSEINPKSKYAEEKVKCHEVLRRLCAENDEITYGWGRVFYAYGKKEKKGRLIRSIIDSLIKGQQFCIKYGQIERDYIYARDVADKLSMLLESRYEGAINICSGEGTKIKDIAIELSELLGKNCIKICEMETEQPMRIIGSDKRFLDEIGKFKHTSLHKACKEIVLDEEITINI